MPESSSLSMAQRPHLGVASQSLDEWSRPQQRLHVLVRSRPLQPYLRCPNSRHREHRIMGIRTCTRHCDHPILIFSPVASLFATFEGSTTTPVTLPLRPVFIALTSSTRVPGCDVLRCSMSSSFVVSPSSPLNSNATLLRREKASIPEQLAATDLMWSVLAFPFSFRSRFPFTVFLTWVMPSVRPAFPSPCGRV